MSAARCTECRRSLEPQPRLEAASQVARRQQAWLLQVSQPQPAAQRAVPASPPRSPLLRPSLEEPHLDLQAGMPTEHVVLPAKLSPLLKSAAVRIVWPVALAKSPPRRPGSAHVIPERSVPKTARAAPSKANLHSAGRQRSRRNRGQPSLVVG